MYSSYWPESARSPDGKSLRNSSAKIKYIPIGSYRQNLTTSTDNGYVRTQCDTFFIANRHKCYVLILFKKKISKNQFFPKTVITYKCKMTVLNMFNLKMTIIYKRMFENSFTHVGRYISLSTVHKQLFFQFVF